MFPRYIYWPLGDGRYDLLQWPSQRVLASGDFHAIEAAARLLGVSAVVAHVRYALHIEGTETPENP